MPKKPILKAPAKSKGGGYSKGDLPGDTLRKRTQRWWEQEETSAAKSKPIVVDLVEAIIRHGSTMKRFSLLQWFRLYNNSHAKGLLANEYFRPAIEGRQNFLTLNIVKSCVDTMVSRITTHEPRVTFLTDGGNFSQQKRAKLLDKFVRGLFYETGFSSKKAPKTAREAYIFGTGAMKVCEDAEERVAIEPVFIEELLADDIESHHGAPRSLYQARIYSRDEIREKFDGNAKAQAIIDAAPIAHVDAGMKQWAEQSDMIAVIEAWHLPAGKPKELSPEDKARVKELNAEAKAALEDDDRAGWWEKLHEADLILRQRHDGRHVLALENGVLHFEAWRKRYFPIVLTHWTKPVRGYLHGIGISEELAGIQYDINRVLIQLSESLPFAVPKFLLHENAGVPIEHFDDLVGSIIKWRGTVPPELLAQNPVPNQLFQLLEVLINRAYEIIGISQQSAASKTPAQFESAAAQREKEDIESGRFYTQGKDYEELFCDVAKLAILTAKEIAERNDGSYPVKAPMRRKMLETIDWKDIDLDEDAWVMQVFPVSALPRTPEGRLAMINDLLTLGFLDKEDALRLLNFPDLDAVNEIMEAVAEYTNWQFEQILEGDPKKPGVMPQPYQNLDYAIRHAQAAYLSATRMGMAESRLQVLRAYIDQAQTLKAKATMPPPGVPGIPTGGGPTMLPPGVAGPGAAPMPAAPAGSAAVGG